MEGWTGIPVLDEVPAMLPLFDCASAIAAGISDGRFSSREIVDAQIARIEGAGKALNAVVAQRFAEARAEADAADRARASGMVLGPLHGVPITIKESFDVAGLATTVGHTTRRAHRAKAHAAAVERLVRAGAVVLGKTNVPKDLADWQSFNDVYGVTRNPWSLEHSPGGSSGGSAAALAAGLTALELGSDIAGSIRVPAVYCGVYGMKPTFGVVPMRGHGQEALGAASDILVAGPLARSAADLELAFDIVAGADEAGFGGWSLSLPAETRTHPREYRIAVVTDDRVFPVDAGIRCALQELAACLEEQGAGVDLDPALPIASREHYELFIALLRGATSARLDDAQFAAVAARASTFAAEDCGYDALMHRGLSIRHRDWLVANEKRETLRHGWRRFFATYDALICPVTTTAAFPHMIGVPKIEQFFDVDGVKRSAADNYYWIGIPALCYLPAAAIPIGQSASGLPVGAQIVGPEFGDKRCLRLARLIETAFRGFAPPPAFASARG